MAKKDKNAELKKDKNVKLNQYIKTSPYQLFCWRIMGKYVERSVKSNPKLEEYLYKAHMRIRSKEYIAYVFMTVIISVIITGCLFVLMLILLPFKIAFLFGIIILVFIPSFVYIILMGLPASKAKARARDIDARIPSAMCFISAMASADVNVDLIFKELARQPVYGEIKNEAAMITRDTELLGEDILTALRKAASRTPSTKFQDFLQGVVTTSTSGGQLKPYFLIKADQFEKEAKLEMKKKVEALGMLAESFVTVVVAFPLFLVVILSIMILVQPNPAFMMNILYAIIVVMIPLAQFGFIFVIWNMSQEK
jgi:flagellar protein FlaJ